MRIKHKNGYVVGDGKHKVYTGPRPPFWSQLVANMKGPVDYYKTLESEVAYHLAWLRYAARAGSWGYFTDKSVVLGQDTAWIWTQEGAICTEL